MTQNHKEKSSSEAHAYTPGLKIKRVTSIQKLRRLPIMGTVHKQVGDTVNFDTIIATTHVPGDPHVINAAAELGIPRSSLHKYLLMQEGEEVKEGDRIAGYSSFFGMINKWITSPMDGSIERISNLSGQIILRGSPVPIEVDSYISGKVIEVLPNEGAVIETSGAFIQGIFGIGGENHGHLKIIAEADEYLTEDKIDADCKGKIIIGGACVTLGAVNKAMEIGVAGIITGGINDDDLEQLLGYEIGVAITGQEEIDTTLVVTEGFGEINMNPNTLKLFKEFDGGYAAINGTTQIRAGVIRPEVIIPHTKSRETLDLEELDLGMSEGTSVRVIREPYFGALGEITGLPVELVNIETESTVRVLSIRLEDGREVTVPRANVEIIEM